MSLSIYIYNTQRFKYYVENESQNKKQTNKLIFLSSVLKSKML